MEAEQYSLEKLTLTGALPPLFSFRLEQP